MYENYMLLLEEEAKIRNLKNRSILCYKNYVSYFLNYVDKDPQELSCQDIDRLLDSTDDLKYKAMLAAMYSSGLRVSEVIRLHYEDISRTNMQIHVRESKSRMDRYTILSGMRNFRWGPRLTASATALRPILWRQGLIPGRSRPCLDTETRNTWAQRSVVSASYIPGGLK